MILISACGGLKFLMFVHNSTVDKPVNSAIGQARPLSELTLFEQQSPYRYQTSTLVSVTQVDTMNTRCLGLLDLFQKHGI